MANKRITGKKRRQELVGFRTTAAEKKRLQRAAGFAHFAGIGPWLRNIALREADRLITPDVIAPTVVDGQAVTLS